MSSPTAQVLDPAAPALARGWRMWVPCLGMALCSWLSFVDRGVLGVLAVSSEYATGQIRATLGAIVLEPLLLEGPAYYAGMGELLYEWNDLDAAERTKEFLEDRFPHVDLVVGAKSIESFGAMVAMASRTRAITPGACSSRIRRRQPLPRLPRRGCDDPEPRSR